MYLFGKAKAVAIREERQWSTHWDDNVLTEFSCYIHLVHASFELIDCCEVDRFFFTLLVEPFKEEEKR